jgi:hypothetical protein
LYSQAKRPRHQTSAKPWVSPIFGAVPIYVGRLRHAEKGAQIEKMFLGGRPLAARDPAPFIDEFFGGHSLSCCAFFGFAGSQTTTPRPAGCRLALSSAVRGWRRPD